MRDRRARARTTSSSRFRYLLVDEFQDTDPLQAELLLLLAADESRPRSGPARSTSPVRPGALFIVGDPKQSIYRFRRADVGVYREICESLVAAGAAPRPPAHARSAACRRSSGR